MIRNAMIMLDNQWYHSPYTRERETLGTDPWAANGYDDPLNTTISQIHPCAQKGIPVRIAVRAVAVRRIRRAGITTAAATAVAIAATAITAVAVAVRAAAVVGALRLCCFECGLLLRGDDLGHFFQVLTHVVRQPTQADGGEEVDAEAHVAHRVLQYTVMQFKQRR